jgi:hypothetical protein
MGPWSNDEEFFDTGAGEPGSEGEGLSFPLDENLATINPLNGETINFAPTTALGEIRDVDDAKGHKFDASAGVLEETGAVYSFVPALDLTADGAIALAGEYKIPLGALPSVKAEGLEIVAYSAGGTVNQRLPKDSLIEDWNEVIMAWADPLSEVGTFDPSAVLQIDLKLHKLAGASILGNVVDHLSCPKVLGPSTGPLIFGGDGSISFDFTHYPESRVGRCLSEPFLCRNVGAFLRAVWEALEDADAGAYINTRPYQQALTTRTIEIRFSEFHFSKYGSVVGLLAQDWTPITRLAFVPSVGTKLWVQLRMTNRNRTNVPVP